MFGLCLIFPRVCKTQIIRKRSGLFGLNSYSQHTIALSVKGWQRTLATGICALEVGSGLRNTCDILFQRPKNLCFGTINVVEFSVATFSVT